MEQKTLTAPELAERYGIKTHTIHNYSSDGTFKWVGKNEAGKKLYSIQDCDAIFKAKHPEWSYKKPVKKRAYKKAPVIQMPLNENLNSMQTNLFTAAQVAELLKAMVQQ